MSFIRAQVTINAFTGLPEHVTTNTWHFGTPVPVTDIDGDVYRDKIYTLLGTFYAAIDQYMSPVLSGTAGIKCYNLADDKPRRPWEPFGNLTFTQDTSYGGMAEEVAICLSFYGSVPITPSKRGRIFLGPLADNCKVNGSATAFSKVNNTVAQAMRDACQNLLGASIIAGCPWVIYSPKHDTVSQVEGGFVDDEFDTIRRRGHDALLRYTWGA